MTVFEKNIKTLRFHPKTETDDGGVLFTKDFREGTRLLSAQEAFALEAATNFQADAVYFRFFPDGREAVPQLYFFDFTHASPSAEEKNRIHIRMWNGNQVPAYVIIENSIVHFFDARVKPQRDQTNYAKEIITLAGDAIKEFNASEFDNGLFWEERNNNQHFKFEQSATRDLIRGLKEVYRSFQEKSHLDHHVALKLLVQSLLIKYLEERDEDSASGYFAGTYFRRNFQCANFCDTIRQGKLLDLLDQLATDFNGKIFEWNKQTEKKERAAIQKAAVKQLADYLDANIQNNQYVIWRLYSFSHLPVEVISSVYEELLTNSKDIVYTPEMIVSTLVDECMPLGEAKQDFKIIDVSCGSGIFLVKAFKRVVQWWRYEQYQKTGNLVKPPLPVLKDLLLKSIHGVDIQSDAIRLSIFSLALAILDEVDLDPPTWGKLRFPDLSENIIVQDFFAYISTPSSGSFDLVIGNPPFNLQQVNNKELSRKKHFEQLYQQFGYKSPIAIPDENPALHFLVQSVQLLKPAGLLCLIQPTGPLLYQRDMAFKEQFFSTVNLLQIIDFTKLADKLWGKTTVATGAVFIQHAPPADSPVLHLVANRSFSNSNRLFLEFDHYDFHYVNRHDVYYNPGIWKANLLGGGRVAQLTERLASLPTLGEFLKKKRIERQWDFGEGFIKNKADEELTPKDIKEGNYKEVSYLTNSLCIETKNFNEDGIGETSILRDKYFLRGRRKEIFQPPLLLIKKGIGKKNIPTYVSDEPISYRHRIIGIHSPKQDREELTAIDAYFKQYADLIRFNIVSTSAEMLVNRATAIFTQDIMNIPYVPNSKSLISEADKLVLRDVLTYYLNVVDEALFEPATAKQLSVFSKVFCKTLNAVYGSAQQSFQLFKTLHTAQFTVLHFLYSTESIDPVTEKVPALEEYIQQATASNRQSGHAVHIRRIMKIYGQDSIILVKPHYLRYWLPSIALRDGDESFADYVKAGF